MPTPVLRHGATSKDYLVRLAAVIMVSSSNNFFFHLNLTYVDIHICAYEKRLYIVLKFCADIMLFYVF